MKTILLFCMILATTLAHAQAPALPFKPLPTVNVKLTDGTKTWYQEFSVPGKTADRSFWIVTAISAALTVADVENSINALRKPGAIEINGAFGAPHPGRLRYYGISLPVFAGMTYFSYKYKREDAALAYAGLPPHRFVKWWLPSAMNAGMHALGAGITLASTGR